MAEKKSEAPQDFEKALARLEAIVKEMETGTLSLDKLMAHFEEGTALAKFCSAKLNEVEKKIEVLVKKGEEITTAPFDSSSAESNPADD